MPSSFSIIKDRISEETDKRCVIPVLEIKQADRNEKSSKTAETEYAEQLAEKIVAEARQEASAILQKAMDEASAEIERLKKEAFDQAYRQGYEQGEKDGYQVGFQAADKEGELIRKQAKLVLESAHKKAHEINEKNQNDIIELSVQIAGKIINASLSENQEYILKIAKEAISEFKNKKQVVIYVSPENAELFGRSSDSLSAVCPNTSIVIMEDEKVSPFGCVIESDTLIIDAQVTSQLEQVKNALLEMRKKNNE